MPGLLCSSPRAAFTRAADVERLKKCGANAILVGESLMRGGDINPKVRELIG